jgi:hypothetical protein
MADGNSFYLSEGPHWSDIHDREEVLTWRLVAPRLWNSARSACLAGVEEPGRTRTNVGWPSFTLAWTMYLPISPVAPTTRILLFPILSSLTYTTILSWQICVRSNSSPLSWCGLCPTVDFANWCSRQRSWQHWWILGDHVEALIQVRVLLLYSGLLD